MSRLKLKYRNTGSMRQVFVWFKFKGKWRYKGVEFNRRYFRVYQVADEGLLPRYRDLWRSRKYSSQSATPEEGKE